MAFFKIMLLWLLCPVLVLAGPGLEKADSLFLHRDFTHAMATYDSLLHQAGEASPQMLLKMAYIAESEQDTAKALYLLNRAYLMSGDEKVRNQIRQLAKEARLKGYAQLPTSAELWLRRHYRKGVLLAFVLIGGGLVLSYYRSRSFVPLWGHALGFAAIALLAYLALFHIPAYRGVIPKSRRAMAFPEAAPLNPREASLPYGHLLPVSGQHGPWLEVLDRDSSFYVHRSQVYGYSSEE